ncbi:hypothetical protein ACYZT7_16995 [Pseudomonas sp. RT4P38]
MPTGQSHISVNRINRKKRPEAGALQKQKSHRFARRVGERWSAEIAAFLLVSNNKDPSLKKNFKGPSEKIFLLTLPSKK